MAMADIQLYNPEVQYEIIVQKREVSPEMPDDQLEQVYLLAEGKGKALDIYINKLKTQGKLDDELIAVVASKKDNDLCLTLIVAEKGRRGLETPQVHRGPSTGGTQEDQLLKHQKLSLSKKRYKQGKKLARNPTVMKQAIANLEAENKNPTPAATAKEVDRIKQETRFEKAETERRDKQKEERKALDQLLTELGITGTIAKLDEIIKVELKRPRFPELAEHREKVTGRTKAIFNRLETICNAYRSAAPWMGYQARTLREQITNALDTLNITLLDSVEYLYDKLSELHDRVATAAKVGGNPEGLEEWTAFLRNS